MSFDCSDGEPVSVYRKGMVRARKDHACSACRETIRRGDLYSYTFVVFDGDAETTKRCARCELLFRALVKKGAGDTYPMGALDCGETWQDHWDEEPPDEIARLAFALPDEMQREIREKGTNDE